MEPSLTPGNELLRCGYCGIENSPASSHCSGCGLTLAKPVRTGASAIPPVIRDYTVRLRAGTATLVFLSYFGGQFAGGIAGSFVAGFLGAISGSNITAIIESAMPFTIFASMIFGGVAMAAAAVFLIRGELKSTAPDGASWAPGNLRKNTFGTAIGIAMALIYVETALLIGGEPDPESLGPIAKMAMQKGFVQVLWAIIAVLLAPPIEELMFRGVFYGGYRKSFGPGWAAVVTTVLFVLLHITEIVYYWPAILGISAMAVIALWMRLRSNAVGPAIASHFGYNLTLTITAFIAT